MGELTPEDVAPPEVSKWQFVEEKVRGVFEAFAYRELRSAGPDASTAQIHAYAGRGGGTDPRPIRRYTITARPHQPRSRRLEAIALGEAGAGLEAELIAMAMAALTELGLRASGLELILGADDHALRDGLLALGVRAELDPNLSSDEQGAGTAFAIRTHGAREPLCTGGCRDRTVDGGARVPAFVVTLALDGAVAALPDPPESFEPALALFVAPRGREDLRHALPLAHRLRLAGIRTQLEHRDAGLEAQLARARASGARLALLVGAGADTAGQPRASGPGNALRLIDLATGDQEDVELDDLESTIQARLD